MAKSNGGQSTPRKPAFVIPSSEELIATAQEVAAVKEPQPEPPKPAPVKSQFEMPPSYMLQQGAMMNLGNLANSSPGSDWIRMAATATEAAAELVSEFARQTKRIKDLEAKAKHIYPMPINFMLKMSAMMVHANFYNASSGRHYQHMARHAFEAAYKLCEEYIEIEDKRIAALGG